MNLGGLPTRLQNFGEHGSEKLLPAYTDIRLGFPGPRGRCCIQQGPRLFEDKADRTMPALASRNPWAAGLSRLRRCSGFSNHETSPTSGKLSSKFWYLPRLTPTSSGPHHRDIHADQFIPAVQYNRSTQLWICSRNSYSIGIDVRSLDS
jgi:hypothetical protein